jgi:hypothetical protein
MGQAAFRPVSVIAGLLSGLVASKLFEFIWARFDDEDAPEAEQRDVQWSKLLIAVAIEGAIFRLMRALTDRGTRVAFERATGTWPGEDD